MLIAAYYDALSFADVSLEIIQDYARLLELSVSSTSNGRLHMELQISIMLVLALYPSVCK